MNERSVASALGLGRIAIGTAFLVAPRLAATALVGGSANGRAVVVLGRIAGIRDIALGAGLLGALAEGRARRWLRWSAACDLVDGLAAATAGGEAPWLTRRAVPILALGAAALLHDPRS